MQVDYGLVQEQTQRLVMTAQMKQALDTLQWTAEELDAFMQEAMLENPLLEYESPYKMGELPWSSVVSTRKQRGSTESSSLSSFDQRIKSTQSREEKLAEQIRMMQLPDVIRRICLFLIGLLDEYGYLRESEEELQGLCHASLYQVRRAIQALQCVEPLGIGARDLRECLRLQLELVPVSRRALVAAIIEKHLEDVARGRLVAIVKELKSSPEAIQQAVDDLRNLNPRPGLMLDDTPPQYIVPEVVVRRVGDVYQVYDVADARGRVFVNRNYQKLMEDKQHPEIQQFLRRQVESIEWITQCLERRMETLLKVAQAIVDIQSSFFECGPRALKPLTLRQVAERVELHESTVSRAVRGKYMDTPQGVLEFKYFFNSEIRGDDSAVSAQAVKSAIQSLIASEQPDSPLSDADIAQAMKAQGISVSRRTVAKYREQLHIPTSLRRKRISLEL
ncbi:RNA polymerase factor sigma-54 [Alicyclobacillus suci]|uniref:RNA polymerase factor sigma-54 n=1 Tax=Alicyclobacillus suci TaxID=2816080 RepID=UPI001A8DEC95|nr:RNA polymerase factor sigma-54 [Alicyclobacillus suci]